MPKKPFEEDLKIMQGLADGVNIKEIASRLSLAPNTVQGRVQIVGKRFEAANATHLVSILLRKKLIK